MGLLCTRQRKLQLHGCIFTVTLQPQKTSPSFHQLHPLNGLPIISFFQRKFSIFRKYNFSAICFVSTSAKFGISTDMGLNGGHILNAHIQESHLDPHCNGNSVYIFLFWELRGLSSNFHIHMSVSDLYIPRIGPHISSSRKGRPIVEIYNSPTDT